MLACMKPIVIALIVAALLASINGAARAGAEVAQRIRPFVVIQGIDNRAPYHGPPSCVPDGRRSANVHRFLCRGSQPCILPVAKPLPDLLHKFKSVKIVKIGPGSDGCMHLTVLGELKLSDAPPWAGTAYSGWQQFSGSPWLRRLGGP